MNRLNYSARIEGLTDRFDALEVDGMLLHSFESRRYFSGFTGSHGWLIVSDGEKTLFTDQRYIEQAEAEAEEWTIKGCGINRLGDLGRVLKGSGISRLGFEADTLTVAEYNELTAGLQGITFIPMIDLSVSMRAVKDGGEQDRIRRALGMAEDAFLKLLDVIEPGMKEREVAALLEKLMCEQGSEGPAFDTIVARGSNTSKPHHAPGQDKIGVRDAVLLDFGARCEGYRSDITRMIFMSGVPAEYKDILDATEEALRTVEEGLKPGMTGAEADALARDVYIRRNLEQYTLRGLGHGVGLAIHEWPRVVMEDTSTLEPGMICTLEPGVYLSGKAGVRLEDLVLITETGIEVLNTTPWAVRLNKE